MKGTSAVLAVLLLMTAASFGQQQAPPSAIGAPSPSTTTTTRISVETSGPVVDQIKKIEEDWSRALLNKDRATIARLEADEYTFIDPTGKTNTKQQDLDSLNDENFTSFTTDEMNVRVYGNTAVVTGVAHVKGTEKGNDISGDYRFTDVFANKDGRWQAITTQLTRIVPLTPGATQRQ